MDLEDALADLFDAATEGQLRYAANLGEHVRGDETRGEITMKIERGEVAQGYRARRAPPEVCQSARHFGMHVLAGMAPAAVMRAIGESLLVQGREFDLARWYVFRVCRHRRVYAGGAVATPDHWLVLQVAQEACFTSAAMASIRNEVARSGLLGFSSTRDANHLNGSTSATAYRFVLRAIDVAQQQYRRKWSA